MGNFVTLAVDTYRQLVLAIDKNGSFRRLVNPNSPWIVPPSCEVESLPRKLAELHRMIDSKIEPQDLVHLHIQLSEEICKMKAELEESSDRQESVVLSSVLIDSSWRIDTAFRESMSMIDLNAMFQRRQIFASLRQSSSPSVKDQAIMEQAITDIHRVLVSSGLNDILIAEQEFLRQAQLSFGEGKSEEVLELSKDWGIAAGEGRRDWMALAEGGLKITGGIIALALVIHDHSLERGAAFAAVWGPFVDLFVGSKTVRDALNPPAVPESHAEKAPTTEQPAAPASKNESSSPAK